VSHTGAPPRSRTSPCSAAATTAPCTRRATRSRGYPTEVPPPARVPGDPVESLRARHDSQGLRITARTGCPSWLGEGLNVGWAIDVLHPLAQRSRPCPRDQGSSPALQLRCPQ